MKKGIIMEMNDRFLTILTPEGEFLRARKFDRLYQLGQEIEFYPVEQEARKQAVFLSVFNVFKGRKMLGAVLAFMLVFMSFTIFYQNNQVYAYMSIDINPSIELGINKNYKVIELIPYNKEGKQVVKKIHNWKKKDVHEVASDIMDEIKSQGYMKNHHDVVIATVFIEEKVKESDKRWREEMDKIKASVQKEDLDLTVVEGTQEDRDKAKDK